MVQGEVQGLKRRAHLNGGQKLTQTLMQESCKARCIGVFLKRFCLCSCHLILHTNLLLVVCAISLPHLCQGLLHATICSVLKRSMGTQSRKGATAEKPPLQEMTLHTALSVISYQFELALLDW